MVALAQAPDLVSKQAVGAAALDKRERAAGWTYPPSFRRALEEHGLFTLGKVTGATDHLCFAVWPLADHKPALAVLAEQLGCKATGAAVAEELGIEEADAAALEQLIVVGCEGHEDHCAFDLRTRDPKTGECSFRLVLFDDLEIADAAKPAKRCKGNGFDTWIARHIAWRAEQGYNDEPEPAPETKPAEAPAPKPKAPKPLRSFAKLGDFDAVPRAKVEKRISKLFAPKKLGKDLWWNEGDIPEVAFVHDGAIRGSELKLGGDQPGIYVIEGDLVSKGWLDLDVDEDIILLVAGDVKTGHLRISFATTLLVEGALTADHVVCESLYHVAIAGKTTLKQMFIFESDLAPKLGKQPKGVVVQPDELDAVVGDKRYGLAPDPPELFKKIIRGKKFLTKDL